MPALALPHLKKLLADRKLAPLHVFVGDDVRLVERMVSGVEATVDPADQPFAVERLYAGDQGGSPIDIAAAARVLPMLGDRRVVIVLRAERLLKPKRASKAAEPAEGEPEEATALDLAPLEDYVANPVPSTNLVFVATEVDRTRRLTKKLLQQAQVTEFHGLASGGPPGRRDARAPGVEFVKGELARAGRTIEPAALQMLVDRAGGEMTKLRGDLERLLLYTEGQTKISRDDVAEIATVGTQIDDWAVVNAIADGDVARALREVAQRFERGDSPHGLVGQLRWWVSQRLAEGSPERVLAALDALLRTDLALKSSGGDDRVLIERLVVDLTGSRQRAWGARGR